MINRYQDIAIKVGENQKRVVRSIIYPAIPRDVNDIYLLTTPGDRLDLLSKTYYGDVGYWWVIAEANAIGKGDLTIEPGTQLRIPSRINEIVQEFKDINE
jgi:hypothetical protein